MRGYALAAFASVFLISISAAVGGAYAAGDGSRLYEEHCSVCHHPKRLGLTAPPLIPGLFSKGNDEKLDKVIRDGLPATQMPAFGDALTGEQIASIVEFIKTPVRNPAWTFGDILESRVVPDGEVPRENTASLENLTLVMERGTKSIAVLDGRTLGEVDKFFVGNVHGGPKYSYDLKKIYSASRDGIVTRYDIPSLVTEVRVKAGIYTRTVAVSPDNRTAAVANQLPQNIVFFDEKMEPIHEIKTPGKVGGFYSLPQMDAFICSFRDLPELWIIDAKKPFSIKKFSIPAPFEDISISPSGFYLMGTKRGSNSLFIYDYGRNRVLGEIPTRGLPHLASAAFWYKNGELMAGVNHIKEPLVTIISMESLKAVAEVELPGAGFFVRTHFVTRYLWVDTMTEEIVLLDKDDYSVSKILKPYPGKKVMHVEFTREGEYALITVPGAGGAVVVYDTTTLEKVRTIPFESPVGKYNATNKTYPAYAMGTPASSADEHPGKRVFDSKCMGCHHQVYDAFGPSFAEIAGKRTPAQIRSQIVAPVATSRALGYRRNSMPQIKLSEMEIRNVVSYILSFRGKEGE